MELLNLKNTTQKINLQNENPEKSVGNFAEFLHGQGDLFKTI